MVSRLPLTDNASRIVGIIGIFRSVTDQKHAEQKISDAVRRRDEFLAMLSHELRNPLGAIVSAIACSRCRTHQASAASAPARHHGAQTQQMARLLDDLLDASRVTQDKIELRRSVLDLRNVARDAVDAMRAAMDGRGVSSRSTSIPIRVRGRRSGAPAADPHQLLSNAAKYTRAAVTYGSRPSAPATWRRSASRTMRRHVKTS